MSSADSPLALRADAQYKTVRSAVAPLLGEARISSAPISELLGGEVVTVVDGRGDWLQVRGADNYEGWTHAGYLMPSSGSEVTWRLSLGCMIRDVVGTSRALPLGARVPPGADVVGGLAIDAESRAEQFPFHRDAVCRSAETLFAGASYLWAGVTPWGCDCSGFVQRIFSLHGMQLPRDAWQQAQRGEAISESISDDQTPGDLLFFSDREDRRITHVGIALAGNRMVHGALMRGGIAVEQLHSGDPYVARLRAQCVGVRRFF